MKIYSWNVNGIRAVWNKGKFQEFVAQHKPDIICLQETKAQPEQSPVDLPDYHEYWHSAIKKGYSGTAIFTRIVPISVINGLPADIIAKYQLSDKFGDTANEGRVMALEFSDFYLVTVYTPNSKGDLGRLSMRHDAWDPAFLEYINQLQKLKPVIFCGDLNVAHQEIDLARPAENVGKHGFTNEERAGFDKIMKSGMFDSFRHFYPERRDAYTWWTNFGNSRPRNIGWRIDYFICSESLKPRIKSAEIYPDVMGSDHCPVSIEIE